MMDWVQVLVLSFVQGITEFLPVSSSAHLILVPGLLGWKDQGLAFDIAMHLGTLMAVIIYFRLELFRMIMDFYSSLKGKGISANARYLWFIGFATIPVGLFGLLMKPVVETALRAPWVIALTTIGFGLLLWFAEKKGNQTREEKDLNWKDVWVIGFSQALSLIPGTSRSGVTLTAGLFRGLTREAAARFSFLLSIPVIILAGGLEMLSLIKSHEIVDWKALALGFCLSGISGYICIYYFLKLLNRKKLFPFVLYRIGLGIFIIFRFYF